jgi:hypothetical protein
MNVSFEFLCQVVNRTFATFRPDFKMNDRRCGKKVRAGSPDLFILSLQREDMNGFVKGCPPPRSLCDVLPGVALVFSYAEKIGSRNGKKQYGGELSLRVSFSARRDSGCGYWHLGVQMQALISAADILVSFLRAAFSSQRSSFLNSSKVIFSRMPDGAMAYRFEMSSLFYFQEPSSTAGPRVRDSSVEFPCIFVMTATLECARPCRVHIDAGALPPMDRGGCSS